VRIQKSDNPRTRIVCFPYLGASAAVFSPWAGEFPDDIEVLAVQLPGRDTRLNEEPVTDGSRLMLSIAESLVPLLDRPTIFYGHSFGAALAAHIAALLRKYFQVSPKILCVGASPAPDTANPFSQYKSLYDAGNMEMFSMESVIELLRTLEAPESFVNDRSGLERLLPAIQTDMRLALGETHRRIEPFDIPVRAYLGESDTVYSKHDALSWREFTSNSFSLHRVPGGHLFLDDPRGRTELLGDIREAISSLLSEGASVGKPAMY
jgi:medium-chain acyl-[acyl-carrier-protein] hydrolase